MLSTKRLRPSDFKEEIGEEVRNKDVILWRLPLDLQTCVWECLHMSDLVAGMARLSRRGLSTLARYWSSATHVDIRTLVQSTERQQEVIRGCMAYLSMTRHLQRLTWKMSIRDGTKPIFPSLGDVIRCNARTLYFVSIVSADCCDIDLLHALAECTSLRRLRYTAYASMAEMRMLTDPSTRNGDERRERVMRRVCAIRQIRKRCPIESLNVLPRYWAPHSYDPLEIAEWFNFIVSPSLTWLSCYGALESFEGVEEKSVVAAADRLVCLRLLRPLHLPPPPPPLPTTTAHFIESMSRFTRLVKLELEGDHDTFRHDDEEIDEVNVVRLHGVWNLPKLVHCKLTNVTLWPRLLCPHLTSLNWDIHGKRVTADDILVHLHSVLAGTPSLSNLELNLPHRKRRIDVDRATTVGGGGDPVECTRWWRHVPHLRRIEWIGKGYGISSRSLSLLLRECPHLNHLYMTITREDYRPSQVRTWLRLGQSLKLLHLSFSRDSREEEVIDTVHVDDDDVDVDSVSVGEQRESKEEEEAEEKRKTLEKGTLQSKRDILFHTSLTYLSLPLIDRAFCDLVRCPNLYHFGASIPNPMISSYIPLSPHPSPLPLSRFLLSCPRIQIINVPTLLQSLPSDEAARLELDSLWHVHFNFSMANVTSVCQIFQAASCLRSIVLDSCDMATFYRCIVVSPSRCKTWQYTILRLVKADLPLDFDTLHRLFSNVDLSTYELKIVGSRPCVRAVLGDLLPWLQIHYPTLATYKNMERDLNPPFPPWVLD